MNILLTAFAFGATLLLASSSPLAAQAFADVPDRHWAHDAIEQLKASGLLVGYPDGTFGGGRPLSRYEYAAAASRAYRNLLERVQAQERGLAALQERLRDYKPPAPEKGEVSKAELQELNTQLEELKKQLTGIRDYQKDIEALKKLTSEFEKELGELGEDVDAMKMGLRSLEERVAALEEKRPPFEIHGDYHVVGFGGHSRDGRIGVSQTGNLIGSDGSGNPVGLPKDLHLLHEMGLELRGEYGRVQLEGELLFSTLLSYVGGGFGILVPGSRRTEGPTDILIGRLNASWQDRWFGAPMRVQLGRLGYRSSNYFAFSRLDPDPYTDIERWDDGNWYFDGGILEFGLGSVDLTFHGGRNSRRGSAQSVGVWEMLIGRSWGAFQLFERPGNLFAGLLFVDTHVGADVTYRFGENNHVSAQYIVLDAPENPVLPVNRQVVMGLDSMVDLTPRLTFWGTFADADLYRNDRTFQTAHNYAYDLSLVYHEGDAWWVGVGYRYVAPLFAAPGSWDRLGYWHNPNDVKGFGAWAHYRLPNGGGIWVNGQFLTGTELLAGPGGSRSIGLMNEDDITSLAAYLRWPVAHRLSLLLGWEGLFWKFAERTDLGFAGGDVDENYFTAELTYEMGEKTLLRLGYQVTNYRNKSASSFLNAPGVGTDRADGGLFFSQFSVRF